MVVVLLGLIGISCWISQSLLDLLTFLLLFSLLYSNRNKLLNSIVSLPRGVHASFIFYFLTACIGYAVNARPEAEASTNLAKFTWVFQLILFIWAAFTVDWKIQLSKNLNNVLKFFIWASLIPSLYSFNIYLLGGVDAITLKQTGYRIVGFVNSATYHGLIGAMIFVFSATLVLLRWKSLNSDLKIMSPLFLILVSMSSLLTMTRGVWLSLAGAVVTLGVVFKKWKWGLALVGISLLTAVVFNSQIQTMIEKRSGSDDCRVKLFETHVRIFKAYPFFGIGYRDNLREIKDFWPESEIGRCAHLRNDGNHAHNQYLNVLATTGIFGFIFFIIFHGYFLLMNIRLVKQLPTADILFPISLGCLLVQVFFLISNLTETSFEYGKVRTVLLLAWAISFVIYKNLNSVVKQQMNSSATHP